MNSGAMAERPIVLKQLTSDKTIYVGVKDFGQNLLLKEQFFPIAKNQGFDHYQESADRITFLRTSSHER